MGQLERYGLYVLCLVIFLILGIAIWGDSPVPVIPKDAPGASLTATSGTGPDDSISEEQRKKLEREAYLNEVVKIVEGPSDVADLPIQPVTSNARPVDASAERQRTPLPTQDSKPEIRIHVVKQYETLEEISLRYLGKRSRWRQILDLNPRVQPTALKPGMKLKIPPRQNEKGKAGAVPGTVVVRRGDSPGLISQRLFGTTKYADEIMRLNNITDPRKLKIGAVLKVPQVDVSAKR
jgi:nucleoid-associated protein YgaU